MRKNCSSDGEKLLKFKAECKIVEIARTQFIQTVRKRFFRSNMLEVKTIIIQIGKRILGFINLQKKLENQDKKTNV